MTPSGNRVFSEVIERAWRSYKANFRSIFWVIVICYFPLSLLQAYLAGIQSSGVEPWVTGLTIILSFLAIWLSSLSTGAIYFLMQAFEGGRAISWKQALGAAKGFWWRILVTQLSSGICVMLGCVLFLFPGLFIFARLGFADVLVVAENVFGADALKRCWGLTRDKAWPVFCWMTLAMIPGGTISYLSEVLPWHFWLLDGFCTTLMSLASVFLNAVAWAIYIQFSTSRRDAPEEAAI